MAKIDTSKIENFDTMSDEEKIKALQDFDFVTSEELEDELKKAKKAKRNCSSKSSSLPPTFRQVFFMRRRNFLFMSS